jgi:hypothetical protein
MKMFIPEPPRSSGMRSLEHRYESEHEVMSNVECIEFGCIFAKPAPWEMKGGLSGSGTRETSAFF